MGFNPWLSLQTRTILGIQRVVGGGTPTTRAKRQLTKSSLQTNIYFRVVGGGTPTTREGRYKSQPTKSSLQRKRIWRIQRVVGGGTPTTRAKGVTNANQQNPRCKRGLFLGWLAPRKRALLPKLPKVFCSNTGVGFEEL